ncbi:DUF3052 domain-containing protein [Flagellimonas sp. S3867]|uniref:DUF3052 domain-containing protein n=1 Tax=Flagellimonas sp. S3867 TaxID=2768063 RepID=UPI0016871CCA|nr:DUF3052 domain-containing protein [Flagellimonas sp. S3867]
MPAGYSGTPLAKKLGIKEGCTMLLHNPPKQYFNLFSDFPSNVIILDKPEGEALDFIHVFTTTIQELKEITNQYKPFLKKNGLLWVSWPKGSSNIPTDLKRDPIREYLLSIGLVDVKVAAIDKDWSGLKFVYRLKDRA